MDVKTSLPCRAMFRRPPRWTSYTHITNPMRSEAAAKIDQKIGKAAPQELPAEPQEKRTMTTFQPYAGRKRKPGTGCITQISENCWEGRYSPMWPDGKKHSRNVYGHTEKECEEKLKELILQMKTEIAALRSGASTEYSDGVTPKKKAIAAYLRAYLEVTNKPNRKRAEHGPYNSAEIL